MNKGIPNLTSAIARDWSTSGLLKVLTPQVLHSTPPLWSRASIAEPVDAELVKGEVLRTGSEGSGV